MLALEWVTVLGIKLASHRLDNNCHQGKLDLRHSASVPQSLPIFHPHNTANSFVVFSLEQVLQCQMVQALVQALALELYSGNRTQSFQFW